MKLLKTILLLLSILFSALIWVTRGEDLTSLSAYATADNNVFYNLMHLTASWFFLLNARVKKYATEYLLALGMGLILAFDMYKHTSLHNIVTVVTILLACFTLLWNRETSLDKKVGIAVVISAVSVFVIGYFTDYISFLLAEILVMVLLSSAKLKEIHG
jgi:hypothetical protein